MTTHQSRSAHLVSVISTNNKKIEEYLKEQRLPPLSLGPDGPLDVQLPPEIEQCRQRLVDASLELGDLATGPVELRLVPGWSAITMFTVTKFIFDFDIVHKVPLTGDISYGDLSTAVNVSTSVLRQVLRAGMPYHMFYEPQPGFVAHTATTKVMVHKPLIKDWTGLNTDVLLPSAAGLTDALKKYPAANDITQTSFQVAKGGGETGFYLYMEKHPAQAERFAGVMAAFQHDKSYATEHLIESWPGDVKSGKVVDLGGSTGAVAFALATQYPKLDIVVQDLPGALKAAQIQEGRNVSFMAHDFFSEQPILGADIYMFRWVLHNWPDAYVHRILRALIPALKPGARVIIFDEIMPPAGTMSLSVERNQRTIDLGMLLLFNAKIRDVEEWKDVVAHSDRRFKVTDVRYPKGSRLSLIEIVWQP